MSLYVRAGNRKQFLIANSKTIYGFVEAGGKKFATDCSSYTDKTCNIQCKVGRVICSHLSTANTCRQSPG